MGLFRRLRDNREHLDEAREIMSQPGFAELIRSSQQMAAQLQASGEMQHMIENAQQAATLMNAGVVTPATVKSVEREAAEPAATLGGAPPGFGPAGDAPAPGFLAAIPPQARVVVEVEPPEKPAYEASFMQAMPDQLAEILKPGARLTVRVDPNDPSSIMLAGFG